MTAAGSDDAFAPAVLVLPAFDETDFDVVDDPETAAALPHELEPWLAAYDFEETVSVSGANAPVLVAADDELALTATGMGKAAAATTVAACCASPRLDLSETVFLTVGIAGGPPERTTLGSVVVADAVVDWDVAHRWSERDAEDDEDPVELLRFRPADYVHVLDDALVERATTAARGVSLADDATYDAYRERFAAVAAESPDDSGATSDPAVSVGTTVTGDEFWHGETFAAQASWLCEAYGVGPYATTQMEDYATATALSRFGHVDRYVSVRAVANFDRPAPGRSVRESLADDDEGFAFGLALENAFRVGRAVVDAVVDD